MDESASDSGDTGIVQRPGHPTRRRLLMSGLVGGALAGFTGVTSSEATRPHRIQRRPELPLRRNASLAQKMPADCSIFPPDNAWNTPIDDLPVDARSDAYIASIGPDTGLHPDFGSGEYDGSPLGIPFVVVTADQDGVEMTFEVADESDSGPYPVPEDAPIEGGTGGTGDRHVIVVQEETCLLFELYAATPRLDGSWEAFSGARFDLMSNDLRKAEWTSADAAGLPILPGLVRYEEIDAGVIPHALRFTAAVTQEAWVWPARHQAGATTDEDVPPMGQRFRLKAGVDIDRFSPTNRIILQALKTYGMLLADNGSDWFLSGCPDDRWDNDDLHELQEGIQGDDFEAVDCSSLIDDPDSGQVA